jgi:hypothetical protein
MALKKIRAAVRKNTPIIFLLFFLETGGLLSHFFNVKLRTRRLYDFLANVYLAFFGSIASIVALIWFALDKVQPTTFVWLFLVPTTFILFSVVAIYSIRVRQENIQFRNFMKTLHRINHDYRDMLSAAFKHPSQEFDPDQYLNFLKQSEIQTIRSACQKVAKIFTAFTHSECTVTVKLITRSGGKDFSETFERSEENSVRDIAPQRPYELNTGANIAFDKALMHISGVTSRFQSDDLTKEKDYRNQRDHWSDFYKNTIVVPIRSVDPIKMGSKDSSDDIGFLCVDTLSLNRLNNTWHVELLAAFADQMYNFMSLMRGKYRLKAGAVNMLAGALLLSAS